MPSERRGISDKTVCPCADLKRRTARDAPPRRKGALPARAAFRLPPVPYVRVCQVSGGRGPDVTELSCLFNEEAAAGKTGCFWFPGINTKRSRSEEKKAQREARIVS